ncbi:MAG TPA: hypothetical protein DHU96_00380 [Actinobacteria bacterium]|nr:hypothetical protein [Actinomycetota bacterium]
MALQITPAAYQLPSGIAREVVFAQSGGLLIAGGLTQRSAATDAITLLNPETGKLTPAGRLAAPTHDAAGAMLAGRPYVFGGGAQASVGRVQALNRHRTATVAGQLPGPRSDTSAVTLGATAYLIGGYDGLSYDANVLATTDGRRFRTVATLPVPVRYPAVAGAGNRIWVFGGQSRAGLTNVIQQVELTTGRVTIVGHLPAPTTGAVAFGLGSRIYIAGGQIWLPGGPPTHGGPPATPGRQLATSNAVLAFDPAQHTVTLAGSLPVPVANAAAAVLAGTAFLVGGNNGQRQVPTVTRLRLVAPSAALPPASPGTGTVAAGLTQAAPVPAGSVQLATALTAGVSSSILASAPWLGPAHGRGHLAPHSDPSVLPGDILIADNWNNRLLIVDPQGRIRWKFPRHGDLAPGQTFLLPDDAFFSPNGRYIIATEEEDSVISVIDIARHKIVYRYGTPGVPGNWANHLANPDDAMLMPGGTIIAADIENCRVLLLRPPSHRPRRVIGRTSVCGHNPAREFASPNGAFPTTSGRYLVTEINGDWANSISLSGHAYWSTHPPGVSYPSDTNEIYPNRYLTADYSSPGQVVEFDARGRLLWRFGGLNHPSLALPLPNGDILVNDDYNDRVIVIDPITNRIVWQYGHTGVSGTSPGYLNDPDGVDLVPPDSMLITHAATMGRP